MNSHLLHHQQGHSQKLHETFFPVTVHAFVEKKILNIFYFPKDTFFSNGQGSTFHQKEGCSPFTLFTIVNYDEYKLLQSASVTSSPLLHYNF